MAFKDALKRAIIILGIALLIASYQNCAIYRNSDRQYLEEKGVSSLLNSSASASGTTKLTPAVAETDSATESDCEPYLTNAEAERILGKPSQLRLEYEPTTDAEVCVISTPDRDGAKNEASLDGWRDATCTLSSAHIDFARTAGIDGTLPDPHVDGMLSGGSFGFKGTAGNDHHLAFVGASKDARRGVLCRFAFTSDQSLGQYEARTLKQAAALVHAINTQLTVRYGSH